MRHAVKELLTKERVGLIGMQLPEEYKENFNVSSKGPSPSGS
jgi:hypothetical protein